MDTLLLRNQLCFPLYAASREIVKKYTPLLKELDLTYTQYIAMMVIWERETVGVKELGDALYLDSGTLTPLLKKLEKQGLVTRNRSEQDERNLIVKITKDGKKLKEKAKVVPEEMSKCLNIDPDDAQTLYKLLYKILEQ